MTLFTGYGIFAWLQLEQVSQRYGAFYLAATNYTGDAKVIPQLDDVASLIGRRVHFSCSIIESRVSAHAGDKTLNVRPTRPSNDEVIDLGVGVLSLSAETQTGITVITLAPEDGRRDYWLDPRQLYRLHDQTVRLLMTVTHAPCSPAPFLKRSRGLKPGWFVIDMGSDPSEPL